MDEHFKDDITVLVGGFGGTGVPTALVSRLAASGATRLTIVTNDTGTGKAGVGMLIAAGAVSRLVCSYVGQNRVVEGALSSLHLELVPQGILAERIRAGGAGLEGIVSRVRGESRFEPAIRADLALIHADSADTVGNLRCIGTDMNFNPVMAPAARTVLAQVDRIHPGPFELEQITIPSIYVDIVYVHER